MNNERELTMGEALNRGRDLDNRLEALFAEFDVWSAQFGRAFCVYVEELRASGHYTVEQQKEMLCNALREFMRVQSDFLDSCPDDFDNEDEGEEEESEGCSRDGECSTRQIFRLIHPYSDKEGEGASQLEFYEFDPDAPVAKALFARYFEFYKEGAPCGHEFFTECSCRASCDICGESLEE